MREVGSKGCRHPQCRSGRHVGGLRRRENTRCLKLAVDSARVRVKEDPAVGWEKQTQGAGGWGANDYMRGMGRQTEGSRLPDEGSSTGSPRRLVSDQVPSAVSPVSLNPRTPGWRAGVAWEAQQQVTVVGLFNSARDEAKLGAESGE
jgi:hypothetical protein